MASSAQPPKQPRKVRRSAHEASSYQANTAGDSFRRLPAAAAEHAVALLGDDLLGLRDRERDRGIAVGEDVGAHETVLLQAVGELLGDRTGGEPSRALAARR